MGQAIHASLGQSPVASGAGVAIQPVVALKPLLRAYGARFRPLNPKVSQNHGVSPKSVDKACRTPYSHFRAGKSALEILRFPFGLAFSPKELMVLFLTLARYYGQKVKCRRMCTCRVTHDVRTSCSRWSHLLTSSADRIPTSRIDLLGPPCQYSHKRYK